MIGGIDMRGLRLFLLFLLVGQTIGISTAAAGDREEVIEHLSEYYSSPGYATARKDLKAMGTNAVPILIEVLAYEPTRFDEFYQKVYAKASASVRQQMTKPAVWEDLSVAASSALSQMDETRLYLRDLFPLLQDPRSQVRVRAAAVLSTHARHVDKALLLELVPLLNDKDPQMREAIIRAVGYDVAKLPRVKAALEETLQDPVEGLRVSASWALLRADKNHAASLATLKSLFTSTNEVTRHQAASNYLNSDRRNPRAEDELLPIFLGSLTSTNFLVNAGAPDALRKFGSRARVAVPGLQQLLTNQHLMVRESATNALMEIAPEVLKPVKP